jgi:hypothetical protein
VVRTPARYAGFTPAGVTRRRCRVTTTRAS